MGIVLLALISARSAIILLLALSVTIFTKNMMVIARNASLKNLTSTNVLTVKVQIVVLMFVLYA